MYYMAHVIVPDTRTRCLMDRERSTQVKGRAIYQESIPAKIRNLRRPYYSETQIYKTMILRPQPVPRLGDLWAG